MVLIRVMSAVVSLKTLNADIISISAIEFVHQRIINISFIWFYHMYYLENLLTQNGMIPEHLCPRRDT